MALLGRTVSSLEDLATLATYLANEVRIKFHARIHGMITFLLKCSGDAQIRAALGLAGRSNAGDSKWG
jgi:hypothetical protein